MQGGVGLNRIRSDMTLEGGDGNARFDVGADTSFDGSFALLTLMGLRSEGEGACEQVAVDIGLVGLDLRDQLVDEVLMTLLSFDQGHK